MSNISIQELPVETHIGITKEERSAPQTLTIGIWLQLDISKVKKTDNIEDTINYDQVIDTVIELTKQERNTIEKFGEDIAQHIMQNFTPNSVTVHVQKKIRPDGTLANVTIEKP